MLDADVLRAWARGARTALSLARPAVDAVNVFPVADADTGTNVLLTVVGGAEAVDALEQGDAVEVAQAFARGALLAARGNSGIIVSQYLAGFADGLAGAGPSDDALVRSLGGAARAARGAVAEPVEGTVLTLADVVAGEAAALAPGAPAATRLAAVLDSAHAALGRISEAHPVLRREHVVDAGACALLVLLESLHRAVTGAPEPDEPAAWLPGPASHGRVAHGEGGAYEVMLVVRTPGARAARAGAPQGAALDGAVDTGALLRERLVAVGDSVAVVGRDDVWHVHVHTDRPDAAVAVAADAGAREQVVVRLVDAPHGQSGCSEDGPVAAAHRGLVVCTASPPLAAWYAAAGAVVLVAVPDAPLRAEHVARAVADTGAPDVALVPGGLLDEDALAPRPGAAVEVLPADDELRSVVAVLAFASSGTGPHGVAGALGRLRTGRADDVATLPVALAGLLTDRAAESLTVLHRDPLDAETAVRVAEAAAVHGDVEPVLVGPTGTGTAFWLGVD